MTRRLRAEAPSTRIPVRLSPAELAGLDSLVTPGRTRSDVLRAGLAALLAQAVAS